MVNEQRSSRRRRKLPIERSSQGNTLAAVEDFSFNTNNTHNSTKTKSQSNLGGDDTDCPTLQHLKCDLSRISSNPIKESRLINVIARASASFPHRSSVGSLLLEEKISEILNISRGCFKSVSYDDGGGVQSESFCYLRICIHCLRAIGPLLKEKRLNGMAATSIKVLYHCILACEKLSMGELKKDKENKTSQDAEILLDATVVCIAGYQVLGMLLGKLITPPNSEDRKQLVYICPYPNFELGSKDLENIARDDMKLPLQSIIKIVTQSSICMSKMLWKTCLCMFLSMDLGIEKSKWEYHNVIQFGDHFREMVTTAFPSSKKPSSFIGICKGIICSIVCAWNTMLYNDFIRSKNEECIEDSIQVAVQAYKSLTEWATEIESCFQKGYFSKVKDTFDQNQIMKESVKLRGGAVLVLMLQHRCRSGEWAIKPLPLVIEYCQRSTWKVIWGKACTLAKKASIHYASYCSKGGETRELLQFHENIGDTLDRTALHMQKVELCYIEYCAYRATHYARSNKGVQKCALPTSKSCDDIYNHLPFPYASRIKGVAVILGPFYAALASVHHLPLLNIGSAKDLDTVLKKIIKNFTEEFFQSQNECDVVLFKTCYQLFSTLPVFQLAFNFINDPAAILDYDEYQKMIVIGNILGEIVAPLNIAMATKDIDDKYLEKGSDAYLRSASLFNHLGHAPPDETNANSMNENFIDKSDIYMSQCFSIHLRKPSSASRYEVIGKVSRPFISNTIFCVEVTS